MAKEEDLASIGGADANGQREDIKLKGDATSTYNDPDEVDTELKGGASTTFGAAFNMTKTIVGAGIFGLPLAYQNAGFITSTILIILLGLLVKWTLKVLLMNGIKTNNYSYHSLMHECFGRVGALAYALFAFLFAFGGMIAYSVIIGDTVPIVMRAMFGVASKDAELSMAAKVLSDRRFVIAFASFFIMLPISSFRTISKLAKFSIFALVAIVLIAIFIMVAGSMLSPDLMGSVKIVEGSYLTLSTLKSDGIYGAVGTICFAFVCHHNTYIIFRSLKAPTKKSFNKVITYSIVYAMAASIVVGISGYAVFSDKIDTGNVLNLFPNTNVLINVARALFALDMFLTYPLELFIARNTLFKVFFAKYAVVPLWIHIALTFVLITLTTAISVSTCDLGAVLDLTGGFAASGIAFIFPSACAIKISGEWRQKRNIPHFLCVFFGVAVLVLTTWHTLTEAISSTEVDVCKFVNF